MPIHSRNYEIPKCLRPHLCHRGSGKARAGCSGNLKASTPCGLARTWSVSSVSFNRASVSRADEKRSQVTHMIRLALSNSCHILRRCTLGYSYTRCISTQTPRRTNGLLSCVRAHPCCLSYCSPLLTRIREQFGKVDDQVELVAQQLKHVPQLSGGFDAMGFSQGLYRSRKGLPPHDPFLMTTASRGAISQSIRRALQQPVSPESHHLWLATHGHI